jgi:hypothetical protein
VNDDRDDQGRAPMVCGNCRQGKCEECNKSSPSFYCPCTHPVRAEVPPLAEDAVYDFLNWLGAQNLAISDGFTILPSGELYERWKRETQ